MKSLLKKCLTAAFGLGLTMQANAAEPIKAEPIKIGAVLSVTGPAAFLGDPELKTLQLYVEKINEKGGVLGRPLQLVSYDDGSDAGNANAFGKRLIERDGVDFIIGGTTTGSTMAMAPLVERAGVPLISLSGGSIVIDPVRKWIFKTAHTDRMAAERVLDDMKRRGLITIAMLSDTGSFGQSGKKETETAAAKMGIYVAVSEVYGAKDTDITPQLTRIKNTPGVQAMFVFGLGQGPAIISRNVRMLALTLPIYHAHGVASEEFIKLSGGAAEGARLPAAALLVAAKLPDNDPEKPVVLDYIKTYTGHYKEDVSTFGGHAYDALMILTDAIKRANSVEKEKVREAIEQTKGYIGASGTFNMSSTDHMGLDLSAFRLLEVKNGNWVLID